MNTRTVLEKYIACMQSGDNVALADLFDKHGVLHDSSLRKIGRDTMHREGKMAIEMMFQNKFGFNRGAFPISAVKYRNDTAVWYFISYGGQLVSVSAVIEELNEEGLIKRMNIYPL